MEVVDQSTLDVLFYNGVEQCYGLDHVEVEYAGDTVTVTLFAGQVPGERACIELAVLKVVRVSLDEPLNGRRILDGA